MVGRDVNVEAIPHFLSKTLVGRFCEKDVLEKAIKEWIVSSNKFLVGYSPSYFILVRGSITYIFPEENDFS